MFKQSIIALALVTGVAYADSPAKNVIFFLGDGMGPTTVTATRIYAYGEDGKLTMETLPRTARVKTYSQDAQTTDSAPSMSAYMTGVKAHNDVLSMSSDTIATKPGDAGNTINLCSPINGFKVSTLLELAKAKGKAIGAVTTTRVTHATPAATYAHICHRDLENDIAAQAVPGGAGYNTALGDGLDVLMGGGRKQFQPTSAGGGRTDGRDLIDEMKVNGYQYASTIDELNAIDTASTTPTKILGLFNSSHMTFDLDRAATKEPSLAEMTAKAIDLLSKNSNGYMLMVEGGRIDHALHGTQARYALQDAVAFDEAIKLALGKVNLANTLIVVTADHDHTLTINGYGQRTGKTTDSNAGILGTVKNIVTGAQDLDAEGSPYTVLSFGNGPHRIDTTRGGMTLSDADTMQKTYFQEAAIKMPAGAETHGGGDVMLMATGAGSADFKGVIDNTAVFNKIKAVFLL